MSYIALENRTRGRVVGTRIRIVDTWFGRLRGFLRQPKPEPGEGLFIMPCRAVHMYGMGFPLDVLFLDAQGTVVAAYPRLRPRQRSGFHRHAEYAVEVPAGTLEATGTVAGDQLIWRPAARPGAGEPRLEADRAASHRWRRALAGSAGADLMTSDAGGMA